MTEGLTDLGELRILVVDDLVDAATSLSYLLQGLGCKTAVAFGGEMGLRVTTLFQPDLVFLDLHMPGHDGCEILAQARQTEGRVANAVFVCLTGAATAEQEQRCLSAGFDYFVRKPMEPDALGQLLLAACQRKASHAAGLP